MYNSIHNWTTELNFHHHHHHHHPPPKKKKTHLSPSYVFRASLDQAAEDDLCLSSWTLEIWDFGPMTKGGTLLGCVPGMLQERLMNHDWMSRWKLVSMVSKWVITYL